MAVRTTRYRAIRGAGALVRDDRDSGAGGVQPGGDALCALLRRNHLCGFLSHAARMAILGLLLRAVRIRRDLAAAFGERGGSTGRGDSGTAAVGGGWRVHPLAELWNLSRRLRAADLRRQDLLGARESDGDQARTRARLSRLRDAVLRLVGHVGRDRHRLLPLRINAHGRRELGHPRSIRRRRRRGRADEFRLRQLRARQGLGHGLADRSDSFGDRRPHDQAFTHRQGI